jgi:hypothetical protein
MALAEAFADCGFAVPLELVAPLESLAVAYDLADRALAGHWETFVMTRPGPPAEEVSSALLKPFTTYLQLRCPVIGAPAEAPAAARALPVQVRLVGGAAAVGR